MTVEIYEKVTEMGTLRFLADRSFRVLPRKWDYVQHFGVEYVVLAAVFTGENRSATGGETVRLIVALESE